MSVEEIIKLYPMFKNIGLFTYSEIISNQYSFKFDENKTWRQMGFDELDIIEMVMLIEKKFNFSIIDQHIDYIFNIDKKPIDFKQYNRNKIIDIVINTKIK